MFNGGRQFGKFLTGFAEHFAVQFLFFQAKFFNVVLGDGDRVGFGLCNLQFGGQYVRTLKQPLRFRYLLREILAQHVIHTEVKHFSDVGHSVGRLLPLERMRTQWSKVRVRVVSGLTEREHLGDPLTRNGLRALVRFQIHAIDFNVILGRRLLHLGNLAVKLPFEFDLRILAAEYVLLTGAASERHWVILKRQVWQRIPQHTLTCAVGVVGNFRVKVCASHDNEWMLIER